MAGQGRGRGESKLIAEIEKDRIAEQKARCKETQRPGQTWPLLFDVDTSSSETSSSGEEKAIRGRGSFRAQELCTIPKGVTETRAPKTDGQSINILANFVQIEPMKERIIYQYRVDFKPKSESVSMRNQLFKQAIKSRLPEDTIYDGWSDARSSKKIQEDKIHLMLPNPNNPDSPEPFQVTIKLVGEVSWDSSEMLRVYNLNMKKIFRQLGFFQSVQPGAYLHADLATSIGQDLMTVRGFKTATSISQCNKILMNLETVHKLIQKKNVLQMMVDFRQSSQAGNLKESVKAMLIGKLVVTNYLRKEVYKIEDINFQMTPLSTFADDRSGTMVSFKDYYKQRYDVTVNDDRQPLLQVIRNNKNRRAAREGESTREIYLIPELCNIAGLTDRQLSDNRLKVDLIRSSQINPQTRVDHMYTFLSKLNANKEVAETLEAWGYSFAKNPVKIKGRILPLECIGVGQAARGPSDKWPKVDNMGNFEQAVMRDKLAQVPSFPKLVIIFPSSVVRDGIDMKIMERLKEGFMKIGLSPRNVDVQRLNADSPHAITQCIKTLPPDVTVAIVIIQRQNKECYDAIKKLATTEKGLVTQVLTARLMTDDRKARGAAVKIGIQVAAKIGGEPWYINMTFAKTMICGYDTYHDTANRGRSFGAFVASMNSRFSRWFSKADTHDAIEELSTHLTSNFSIALKKYYEANAGNYPDRVFIYRDGVSDGQLNHVFNVELEALKNVIKDLGASVKLTVIIVNKRIGARFYMHQGANVNPQFVNPPPGSVIDDYVTRKERYDFYLISQSTRNGTVAPTYYNIIHDESGLRPEKHQQMAFKMCFLYYNWTGTVRVPAPCQYAHKLAHLCGEHLHKEPITALNDRLHYL